MNIIGIDKDIVDIRLGHESESCALMWFAHFKDKRASWEAYEDGFEQGIRFLANYLKEYNIDIELHDKLVETKSPEHWYSGEIISKH